MEDEVLEKIEAYIDGDEGEVRSAVRDKIGCTIDYAAGRNRYVGYLISLATRSFRGKKVGLDCGNGSSWMIAKSVFDALGAKTYVIANTPDGTNINDNCGSLHVDNLRLLVAEKHLDVGFAFDGDADRCIAVDENGEVVNGDKIIYACAVYMKERGSLAQNTVVTTKMSNLGLWRALEREDIEVIKTDVGDRWVYEAMISGGYKIGGEQSGHVIFAKYATTGDGILTALKVMEVMLESKRPLSELVSPVAEFPQITRNLRLSERKAAAADPDVLSAVADAEVEFGGDGRILLRVSGTEPVLRIMVEAQTDEACRSAADKIEAVIRKKFK
jgi:phosphoglucosamine mutase